MSPALDLPTMFATNALVSAIGGVILLLVRRGQTNLPGVGLWAAGRFIITAACFSYFIGLEASRSGIILGMVLVLTSVLVDYFAYSRYMGRRSQARWPLAMATLLGVLTILILAVPRPNPGPTLAIFIAVNGVLNLATGRFLLLYRPPDLRGPATAIASLHLVWGLLTLARLVFLVGNDFDVGAMASSNTASMFFASFHATCQTVGLLWLVVARLQINLRQKADTDPLTGLLNRRALQTAFESLEARLRVDGGGFAVIILDLDHFKRLNDEYGHAAGDAMLVAVARTTRSSTRPGDIQARLGGEEFCIVLPEAGLGEALDIAERLRLAIAGLRLPDLPVQITASFGVASSGSHGHDGNSLIRAADDALYCAKRNGRNHVQVAADFSLIQRPEGPPSLILTGK